MNGWQQAPETPRTYWGDPDPPVVPAPPGTVYAGVGVRFAAWIIDLIPILIIFVLAIAPVLSTFMDIAIESARQSGTTSGTSPQARAAIAEATAAAMPGLLRASAIAQIGALIYIPGLWLFFSRSPGMALLGLRIVREEDGSRLTVGRVAVRYVGYLLSASFLLFGFAWALFDRRKQTWHDKLAGTVVVRDAPVAVPGTAYAGMSSWDHQRRPSIGAVADRALTTARRAPLALFESMSLALVPGLVLLAPLMSWFLVAQQDQLAGTLDVALGTLTTGIDTSFRQLELTAPGYVASTACFAAASFLGAFLLATGVRSVSDNGAIESPGVVAQSLRRKALGIGLYGFIAGLTGAALMLLVGGPVLIAAYGPAGAGDLSTTGVLAIVGFLILLPVSSYLGTVWALAIVCLMKEDLTASAAWRRAWRLSRRRMRWLYGVLAVGGLSATYLLVPIASLPTGLLADAYLAGERMPTFIMVILTIVLTLLTTPVYALSAEAAYRYLRDADARAHEPTGDPVATIA